MDNNTDKQDIIDRYLMGEMNENESRAFEKEMETDPALREEVELTRHILSAIDEEEEQSFIEAIRSVPEERIRELISPKVKVRASVPPVRKKRSISIYAAAAAAAVLLILLYIGNKPDYSSTDLFTQYYQVQPYETYPVRGDTELTPDEKVLIREARTHYENAEYPEALVIYEQLFTEKQDWKKAPDEVIFYAAICRFETNNLPRAIEQLDYIASDTASDFQDEALWNLAFAYLKNNQRSKAKDCLNRLIEEDSDYVVQAKELLDKLDMKRWF